MQTVMSNLRKNITTTFSILNSRVLHYVEEGVNPPAPFPPGSPASLPF